MRKPKLDIGNLAQEMFIELLEIYNSIPKDAEFCKFNSEWLPSKIDWGNSDISIIPSKNRSEILGILVFGDINFSNPGFEEEWFGQFDDYPTLRDFLLRQGNSIYVIEERLEIFLIAKTIFQAIAEASDLQKFDQPFVSSVSLPSGYITISQDGIIFRESSFILSIFKSCAETGYLNRIKSCGKCENLFFAKRTDALYCSRKCVNAHHQKKYLSDDTNRERINEQRRSNYHHKKKLELITGGHSGKL